MWYHHLNKPKLSLKTRMTGIYGGSSSFCVLNIIFALFCVLEKHGCLFFVWKGCSLCGNCIGEESLKVSLDKSLLTYLLLILTSRQKSNFSV